MVYSGDAISSCILTVLGSFSFPDHISCATCSMHCIANPHGSVVVYLGPNVHNLCNAFAPVAFIPGLNAWAVG